MHADDPTARPTPGPRRRPARPFSALALALAASPLLLAGCVLGDTDAGAPGLRPQRPAGEHTVGPGGEEQYSFEGRLQKREPVSGTRDNYRDELLRDGKR